MSIDTQEQALALARTMRQIQLTRGQVTIVDDEDFDYLNQWKWYADPQRGNRFYATRNVRKEGRTLGILMHRELMMLDRGRHPVVDHINGDGLDNRRCNLRIATGAQNAVNTGAYKNNPTGLKGTSWNKKDKRYRAAMTISGRTKYLGSYRTAEEAHAAYCRASLEYHGEFSPFRKQDV